MPLSTNQLYAHRGVHRFSTTKAKENKKAMAWEARNQYRGMPLEGDIRLSVRLFWGTRRNHDIDNIKGLLDALTGIIWKDDGQITELCISKGYDKEHPRVELLISTTAP